MLCGGEITSFNGQLPLSDRQYGSGGPCHREAWPVFPCYVQPALKIPWILEWEGRALKRISFLLAILHVSIMLKHMWEQITSASRSGGKQSCQAAFEDLTWFVWKSLLDTHVPPLHVSADSFSFCMRKFSAFVAISVPTLTPASYHKREHTVPPVTTPASNTKSDRKSSRKKKMQVEYRVRLLTWHARHGLESTPDVSWTIMKTLYFITF